MKANIKAELFYQIFLLIKDNIRNSKKILIKILKNKNLKNKNKNKNKYKNQNQNYKKFNLFKKKKKDMMYIINF